MKALFQTICNNIEQDVAYSLSYKVRIYVKVQMYKKQFITLPVNDINIRRKLSIFSGMNITKYSTSTPDDNLLDLFGHIGRVQIRKNNRNWVSSDFFNPVNGTRLLIT